MAPTLYTRQGDSQALKVCIAAAASGCELAVSVGDLQRLRSTGANPFRTNTVFYTSAEGNAIGFSEPNVIATLIGKPSLVPSSVQTRVSEWLDWEAGTLRPASYSEDASTLTKACSKLATEVSSSFLVGNVFTVADVAVYSTLLPLSMQGAALPEPVESYLARVASLEAVTTGIAQVLCGGDKSAIVEVWKQDAAVYRKQQPRLPKPGQRNILITSALPYVNNVPHLGNIIGCVLSADCYARYCRARGHNCIYICGTDEYGTATETKALEEGVSCQEVCDKYHAIHRDTYEWFDCHFEKFGRTPSRWQTQICQSLFHALEREGFIVDQWMEQLYSEALGKFLADRYVTGQCPKCGYEDARGDQCDSCGNLLNPTELINPKCKFSGTTPVQRSTQHLFIDLPQLSPRLQEYITTTSQLGGWSSNCVQVTNAWMRDGLKQRCITRDLKWGTPVPREGFEDKVFYVWFDAPIGYMSITAGYTPEWEKWWKNPQDVEMVQFMGKDNVPFHTVIFPATQLGSGENWTMMRNISVTEYLNYEGGKFSKSRGVGVFGTDARDTGIPVEVWRYYLLSNRPEQSDTDFKWSDLAAKNNNELLATLGNYVNRPLMFCAKYFDKKVPGPTAKGQEIVAEFGKVVGDKVQEYIAAMEKIKLKEGIRLAMSVAMDGNKFLQDNKPWEAVKTDMDLAATLVAAGIGLVRVLAALIEPFMPSITRKIAAQANLTEQDLQLSDEFLKLSYTPHLLFAPGHAINEPFHLITAIPDATWQALRDKYGGSQSERAAAAAGGAAAAPAAAAAGKGKAAAKPAGAPGAPGDKAKAKEAKAEKKEKAEGEKKEKKEKGEKVEGAKKEKKEKVPAGPLDISSFDIRVGRIFNVAKHPNADSLYTEEVDIGGEAPLKVCSGLVKHYPDPSALEGRRCLLLTNLKPAVLRGAPSQGMVLCGAAADGSKMELVDPPEGAALGERISVEGFIPPEGSTAPLLDPKEKGGVFESVMPLLTTNDSRQACYKGLPFMTSAGPCTVASIAGGLVK